jgi:Obg family GTPase CgtA
VESVQAPTPRRGYGSRVFHDRAKIWVEGGRGGDGVVSFRREAHVPRGGPDGGDGGRGGDVIVVADASKRDLAAQRHSPHYRAGRGRHGEGAQRHGARGDDEVVQVAPGTTIQGLGGERFDLVEPGQRAVVARGGVGGSGNKRFATSTRQAPRFAERGLEGQSGWIELQLRLLADAGLVGLPNAGKSSLLARLTRAAPKVGDYPFTTLEPVLGTLEADDRQLVLADVPGLIEGAAEGAGLGDEFLAHVERCRALVHLVELAPPEGSPDPAEAYETVRGELGPEEPAPTAPPDEPEFEADHITYRPAAEQGYAIEREGDAFRVAGRGVEMLIARHDLSNHEALAYLEQRLTEMGVVSALRSAGFEPGDEVRIGEEAFELDPG